MLWLSLLGAQAQVPGYLGYKTSLGLELSGFPNVWFRFQEDQPLRLNLQYGLAAERVLTRRISMDALWQRWSAEDRYTWNQRSGTMSLSGSMFTLGVRLYTTRRAGNLPPLGPFHRFSATWVNYRLIDQDRNFYPDQRWSMGSFEALALSYTLGMQRVLYDRVTVMGGLRVGWLEPLSEAPGPKQETYIWDRSMNRSRGFVSGQLVLGVGWLFQVPVVDFVQ